MSQTKTTYFYLDLPVQDLPLTELLTTTAVFQALPADWYVIITDIRNSTMAVESGMQNEINLIATGSIIAALNIARDAHTDIPFFFGGDGASLLVPPALASVIFAALLQHRRNVYRNFKLELRVGQVAVSDIYAAGHSMQITRAKKTKLFSIPILLGNGLKYADRIVKSWDYSQHRKKLTVAPDLRGMECRWQNIPPPQDLPEIVCLIIDASVESQQGPIYQSILSELERIYGSQEKRQPISLNRMRLKSSIYKLATEIDVKLGTRRWPMILQAWLVTLFGQFYLRFNPIGKKYLRQIIELTDTLVIDGRLATVISGTAVQRKRLVATLDRLEQEGKMRYGIYISPESIMSCYVRNRLDQHVHFVDGTEGGYTRAAQMLKRKLQTTPDAN